MAPNLEKFKDPLPIPKVIRPVGTRNGIPYYELEMTEFYQNLHSDMPDTRVWGYENSYPGPIIEAFKDQPIYVRWINRLPDKHFLPIDKTIHGAKDNPEVRTVVHLHGLNVRPDSDGFPDDWFTPGKSALYYYPNKQQAATLWYHDHAIGITRLNVYAGLVGLYLIRDEREERLNLPSGEYEIPLIIQDKDFNDDGSLSYPAPNTNGVEPSIVPGFFGNYALVNGKVWPYLVVKPRKYRFRILNGSNSRSYKLRLSGEPGQILPAWYQIEVLPFGPPLPEIMQFRVCGTPVKDNSSLPLILNRIKPLPVKKAKQRNIEIVVGQDEFGRFMFMLENKKWTDPVTIKPKLGSVEIWNIINTAAGAHPIHVHLVQFQILNQQPFDVQEYTATGTLKFIGPPLLPDENEKGWKDTVKAEPRHVTRIIARFGDFTGIYPYHCHILEHEDHDMMRPFEVVKHFYKSKDVKQFDAAKPDTNEPAK